MLLTRSRPTDVLLVDDDEDVLRSYCHLLNLSGYRPRGLADPEQALALLDDQWPGVLVSDIYMPAMNGLDLLAQVQRIDAEIPVILITGHGDIPGGQGGQAGGLRFSGEAAAGPAGSADAPWRTGGKYWPGAA